MTSEELFNRFSLGIEVGLSVSAKMVIEVIEECFRLYRIPRIIRTDQGLEFRSVKFEKFIEKYNIKHKFTEKGSPCQNGTLESLNSKLRGECPSRNIFENLMYAREVIEEYRKTA